MKQTAVEFIVEQLDCLNKERKENLINAETYFENKKSLIEQAKEMEKQQRVDAFDDGFQQGVQCMTCIYSEKVWDGVDDGEEYVKVQDWSNMRIRNI